MTLHGNSLRVTLCLACSLATSVVGAVALPSVACADSASTSSAAASVVQAESLSQSEDAAASADAKQVASAPDAPTAADDAKVAALTPSDASAPQAGDSASSSDEPLSSSTASESSSTGADAANQAAADSKKPASSTVDDTKSVVPPAAQDAEDSADSEGEAADARVLDDGEYVIESAKDPAKVLDVDSGSKSDSANVQLYGSNMTAAQRWIVSYDAHAGAYSIINKGSGKALDAAAGRAQNGANVQQYASNGTKAQRWIIVRTDAGFVILSAIDSNYALDLASGNTANGANVQLYDSNGTLAQRFWFLSSTPVVPSSAVVDEGVYTIASTLGSRPVIEIAGGTMASGGNAQIYAGNSTSAQSFAFVRASDGSYVIYNVGSGKVLDVQDANLVPGTNVRQWAYNGTRAQRWSLQANADSTYTFLNLANGLALDVQYGSAANGANLQCYTANGSAAQKFSLIARSLVSQGQFYELPSIIDNGVVLDVNGSSTADDARLQAWRSNGTLAQRFEFVSSDAGAFLIKAAASGKYLTDVNGTLAQRTATGASSQQWKIAWNGRGVELVNVATGRALDFNAASTANGTRAQTYARNDSPAQRFLLHSVQLLSNGMYVFHSGLGTVLDVANGGTWNGANVQAYADNGTNAQKFVVSYVRDDLYTIMGAQAGKYLDVASGSKADGGNVQLWQGNGTLAQLWRAVIAQNGFVSFVNAGSGKALDIAGGSSASGANVQQYAANGTAAQSWKLTATTYVVDPYTAEEHAFIDRAQGFSSASGWLILVNRNTYRVALFSGSRGHWTLRDLYSCVVGKPSTPTITGTFATQGRKMNLSTDSRARYCTQISGGYFFHTILNSNAELGHWASHGCVRLAVEDARWLYYNLPLRTTVNIF